MLAGDGGEAQQHKPQQPQQEREQQPQQKRPFDALLLPTLPSKALPLPQGPELAPQACLGQAWCMLQNTAAFDLTGHPALSVNAGWGHGKPVVHGNGTGKGSSSSSSPSAPRLPIGVQIVGRRWEDATVLNVGMAVERLCGGGGV